LLHKLFSFFKKILLNSFPKFSDKKLFHIRQIITNKSGNIFQSLPKTINVSILWGKARMGLGIKNIIDIGKQFIKPLEIGNQIKNKVESEVLKTVTNAGGQLLNTGLNLGESFASRTGLATNLNPFSLSLNRGSSPPPDSAFDGNFVGANGQTLPANTPLSEVPGVTPTGGVRNNETLIYVNGISTDVAGQANSLQAIANNSGSRVVGIHNATNGFGGDILQSLGDKLNIGNNAAVDTLTDTVYNEIKAGRQPHVMAHSQGALITSRAMEDVKNRLMLEDGMSRRDAESLMSNIKVETFGGASRRFTDGPQYVHYVNKNDGVPQAFGLRSWLNPFANAGRDAVTHYFREGKALVSHGFEEFYLPQRVPFDQARQGNFN
jgi:hypothetical protein